MCGCACTSAARARPWPAAPAPARPWWPASAWACWTTSVDVHTRGGVLTIAWQDTPAHDAPVFMTGPATSVFEGQIDIPDLA